MKKVIDLIQNCNVQQIIGNANLEINSLVFDSRKSTSGSMYIAQKGVSNDGHAFIQSAISSGSIAVVCENIPEELNEAVVYIVVDDASRSLGFIASEFYGNPSEKINLIGITGTNGKTTTVTLLHQLFMGLGFRSGMLSTVHNKIGDTIIPATHTTPDAVELNSLLAKMVDAGCEYAFMEVSSHAIVQHRIAGIRFVGGVFSNITHDHLDYHKTFEGYLKAKKLFFDQLPKDSFSLINIDDRNGLVMSQNSKSKIFTYSIRSMADFRGKILENSLEGLCMEIDNQNVWFKLVGEFNAHNIMAVYGVARMQEIDSSEILTVLSNLNSAEGRFEYVVNNSGISAIVDYAHTPDALENVLKTIQDLCVNDQQIITVIGCGGDRDALKRPKMGKIAASYSNQVVLTSDNPRSEDPNEILAQIQAGIEIVDQKKVLTIENRRQAIKTACALAKKGDVVLVAGKGHEKYQEIKGVKHHFDDKEELMEFLNI